jgi:hypothetical protein
MPSHLSGTPATVLPSTIPSFPPPRTQVIGSAEHEAILRGLFSHWQVAALVALETVVLNPFLGVFFSWDHEAVVFTRADKAVNLCVTLMNERLID